MYKKFHRINKDNCVLLPARYYECPMRFLTARSPVEAADLMLTMFERIDAFHRDLYLSGEMDPERLGSGIQYGNASLRRISRQQPAAQTCPC